MMKKTAQNITHKMSPRNLGWLRWVAVMVMMLAWMMPAKAQTNYSGVYYIASNYRDLVNNAQNLYNSGDLANNLYLCPTVPNADWNWYYGDPNMAVHDITDEFFMTTYKCHSDSYTDINAVWIVEKHPDLNYYYIIRAMDNSYLTYNGSMTSPSGVTANRMRIHTESATPDPNNQSDDIYLFAITPIGSSGAVNISPKSAPNNYKYLNINKGNRNSLVGVSNANNETEGGVKLAGIIGLWQETTSFSQWFLETTALAAPTISGVDPVTNKVTVTDNNGLPSGYNIRYTISTNSNSPADPTANDSIMPADGYYVTEECIIKAVIERYGVVLTAVATSGTLKPIPHAPTLTTNCDNTFSLTCDNMPLVDIYYTITTNGDEPGEPTIESTKYTTPVTYGLGYKIKAKAILDGGTSSEITSHEFTADAIHTTAPTITLVGNTVSISGPVGASIYYTTDGSEPNLLSSSYTEPIPIDLNEEFDIRAIAKSSDLLTSCVTRLFVLKAPSAVITADGCSVSEPHGNVLTITGPNDGRTFWYAAIAGKNSAAPDINAIPNPYTQYTGEVVLDELDGSNKHYTIHAYAKSDDGLFNSAIISVNREMKTGGKPVLTPL